MRLQIVCEVCAGGREGHSAQKLLCTGYTKLTYAWWQLLTPSVHVQIVCEVCTGGASPEAAAQRLHASATETAQPSQLTEAEKEFTSMVRCPTKKAGIGVVTNTPAAGLHCSKAQPEFAHQASTDAGIKLARSRQCSPALHLCKVVQAYRVSIDVCACSVQC